MTILSREQVEEFHATGAVAEWWAQDVLDTALAYYDALDEISYLVQQHCWCDEGVYDTGALSTNASAFEFLVAAGRAEYVGDRYGRRSFIRFAEGRE